MMTTRGDPAAAVGPGDGSSERRSSEGKSQIFPSAQLPNERMENSRLRKKGTRRRRRVAELRWFFCWLFSRALNRLPGLKPVASTRPAALFSHTVDAGVGGRQKKVTDFFTSSIHL